MLDLVTLAASFGLLLYGGYAAHWLIPREHPGETFTLNLLCLLVGAIGAAPWVDFIPSVPWPGSMLVVTLFGAVTVWRREAALFVRCRFGEHEIQHPLRRREDYSPSAFDLRGAIHDTHH